MPSLALMHDILVFALLKGTCDSSEPWSKQGEVTFLCPVPGYDRHFKICEDYGIRMKSVPLRNDGPDMNKVEQLVASDPSIKGMWCIPKYSNPTGTVYSDSIVERLASMPTAAPDFRIFWDNAYAVHHLTDEEVEISDVLTLAAEAGHADRPFVFGSTSKITLAGAGVAFLGASPANVSWWLALTAKRTIGPDKTNHLRHVMFLRDADGLREHMRRHRELIAPKFAAVDRVLTERLGSVPGVLWSRPAGGYFVTLIVPDGTAAEVVRLAGEAGIALTPAGGTHPHGTHPHDRTIRLAPTFPELAEVERAMYGVTDCVRLALAQRATPRGEAEQRTSTSS